MINMKVNELIEHARHAPESVGFSVVIDTINTAYQYTPTRFTNGSIVNEAGTNEGSCKVFAFAELNQLSEVETLALFGSYYRDDVMGNPTGGDHANIRNFILDGRLGIRFDGEPLAAK